MSNFLAKIRSKPDKDKLKILIFATIIVSVALFFVWNFLSGIAVGKMVYKNDDSAKKAFDFSGFFGDLFGGVFSDYK